MKKTEKEVIETKNKSENAIKEVIKNSTMKKQVSTSLGWLVIVIISIIVTLLIINDLVRLIRFILKKINKKKLHKKVKPRERLHLKPMIKTQKIKAILNEKRLNRNRIHNKNGLTDVG